MSFIEKVSAAVVIDEKIIEKFEKAQERNKKESLEFFKATLIEITQKTQYLSFEIPSHYLRFLKLSLKTDLSKEKKQALLAVFRNTLGLPEDSFDKNVKAEGKDNALIFYPKELLEAFEYFKTAFNSNLKEGQLNKENQHTIQLQLGQSALNCFQSYLFTGKFEADDVDSLQELIEFAHMICDTPLQEAVAEATLRYFLHDKNKLYFDRSLLGNLEMQFFKEYCTKKDITLSSACVDLILFQVSPADYLKLFKDQKNLNILEFLAEKIIEIEYEVNNPPVFLDFYLIPKQYRNHIKNIRAVDYSEDSEEGENRTLPSFETYRSLAFLFPNSRDQLFLDTSDAEDVFEEHANDAFILGSYGRELLQSNPPKAKIFLKKALTLEPENPFTLKSLASLQLKELQFDKAEATLKKVIELTPDDISLYKSLMMSFNFESRPEESEIYLKRIVASDSKDLTALENLATCLHKQDKWDEEEIYLEKILDISKNSIHEDINYFKEVAKNSLNKNYYNLAKCLKNQGKLVEAETAIRNALKTASDKHSIRKCHLFFASTLKERGKLDEVYTFLKDIIMNSSPYDNADLIEGFSKNNELDLAEICAEKTIKFTPTHVYALGHLGWLLVQKDNLEAAEPHLRKALELDPDYFFANYALAELLVKKNQIDEAKNYLSKSIKKNSNHTLSIELLKKIQC